LNKNTRLIQLSLALLACILAVVLFYAPARKNLLKSSKPSQTAKTSSVDDLIIASKAELSPKQISNFANWEMALESVNETDKIAYLDSLSTGWSVLKNPYLAAHYLKQKAVLDSDKETYLRSGRLYFLGFETLQDSSFKEQSLAEATSLLEKAQELDPKDDDIRLELALCYIESPSNPMRGISLLRQLVEENPQNENALFNLGILSMRSGQYDKAIGRFEEILAFSPERFELFRFIGHCYEQIGENDKAIVYFSRFKSKTKDQRLRDETDRYIEKLKEE